ncbi:MAG: hypothetical protein WBQ34_06905 [Candidatus Acidiferrales bacterium]
MICQNCSANNPDGQAFCGTCGHRLTAETIGSLTERIARLEVQHREPLDDGVNTHNLELQTAENIMSRVRKWTTLILYFTGIPAAIALLALAIIFGKDTFDIRHIAANARESVNAVISQAQDEAAKAKKTADDASAKSQQVDAAINGTEQSVSKLKSEVDARSTDVEALDAQLDATQQRLNMLIAKANSQETQFAKLTRQVQTIQSAKDVADIQAVYPIYGQRVAQGPHGIYIDPKAKPEGAIYLDLNLSLTQTPNITDANAGAAVAALSSAGFTVSVGPVYMIARTASGSAQNVGMGFDSGSCNGWVHSQPPCILYFASRMKGSALKARSLLKVAQQVNDDQIFYLDRAKLSAQQRELLSLSATDIVVVLGE